MSTTVGTVARAGLEAAELPLAEPDELALEEEGVDAPAAAFWPEGADPAPPLPDEVDHEPVASPAGDGGSLFFEDFFRAKTATPPQE